MTFRIAALDPTPYAPLFALSDEDLALRHIVRQIVSSKPGFPCRVSLADAEIGETVLLLNYEHLGVATPYRSAHAIYVRAGAVQARLAPGEIPDVIAQRLISARAFDATGMMTDADVTAGTDLAPLLLRLFADPVVAFVDLHNAKPGCFAARAVRA